MRYSRGHTCDYECADLGETKKLTMPDGAIEQWSYDGNGNTTAYTNPLTQVISYLYDEASRVGWHGQLAELSVSGVALIDGAQNLCVTSVKGGNDDDFYGGKSDWSHTDKRFALSVPPAPVCCRLLGLCWVTKARRWS